MQEKIYSLAGHGTWWLEQLPSERRTVYKKNLQSQAGCCRKPNLFLSLSFRERFLPKRGNRLRLNDKRMHQWNMLRLETLRAILAVAEARDPQILQLDVNTVFFARWSVRRYLYGPTRRFYFASSSIRSLQSTKQYLRLKANITVLEWKIWFNSDQVWLQVQWCTHVVMCVLLQ